MKEMDIEFTMREIDELLTGVMMEPLEPQKSSKDFGSLVGWTAMQLSRPI